MALAIGEQRNVPSGFGNVLGGAVVPAQGIHEESSTQKHPLGTRLQLGDRVYHYAYTSETLSAGKLACSLNTIFTDALANTAHPVGTKSVSINASAAIAVNQLVDGYVVIKSGTGAGEFYKIKSNPAIDSGANGTIVLYDGLVTAWSTSDTKLTYEVSMFRLQEHNTGSVEQVIGVPNVAITDEYFFWAQTWGPCSVLMAGADGAAIGERDLVASTGTVGAVEKSDAVGRQVVANMMTDAADNANAEYSLVYLKLIP